MEILNGDLLDRAIRRHPTLRGPALRWLEITRKSRWKSPEEVRKSFPSADYVKSMGGFVFNLGGNSFRLLARIDFQGQKVDIKRIGTHSDYDNW